MKNKSYGLSISGFGYLQKVIEYPHTASVVIHCLPVDTVSNSRGELVILNCVATDKAVIAKLKQYQADAKINRAVMVRFIACYLETAACYHCTMPDDPERIVQFAVKLTAISEVFVEDINQSHPQTMLIAANW